MFESLRTIFRRKPAQAAPVDEQLEHMQSLDSRRAAYRAAVRDALAKAHIKMEQTGLPVFPQYPLQAYDPPPGVLPKGASGFMAKDAAWQGLLQDSYGSIVTYNGITSSVLDGLGFPGFPYLTELTQITEYRDMSERTAAEMTRKWIKLRSVSGNKETGNKIKEMDADLKKYHIRELFRQAAVLDGFMGRSQIYIDMMDATGDPLELKTPLLLNKYKIKKGDLKGFKIVEPITTYPAKYNSNNPLAGDYYIPSAWFVYGTQVHATRLLTFISRPVPDLLKPVFNFSGISLSQLGQPYVDYWLNTRNSVGKLLRNFSITWLKSDLDTLLQKDGDSLIARVSLFTKLRDNQGVFLLNKDSEEMGQLNTPLSGLDKLQAQAQEHMAAVAKTPLVILLGITPSGLTDASDSSLRIYYDYVADQQEMIFRRPLETILKILQLNKWGEVDDDIAFDFEPLMAMTAKELSEIRKSDGDRDAAYITAGVVSPEEVRERLIKDPDSGYNDISADEVPTPAAPTGEGEAVGEAAAALGEGGNAAPGHPGQADNAAHLAGAMGAPVPKDADAMQHAAHLAGQLGGAAPKPLSGQEHAAAKLAGVLGKATPLPPQEADAASLKKELALSHDAGMIIDMIEAANKLANDGGFRGNQHIGGVSDAGHPFDVAMQLSRAAHKATLNASKLGTGRAHKAAHASHSRAIDAHKRALSSASVGEQHIHKAYIDAHKAACGMHKSGGAL